MLPDQVIMRLKFKNDKNMFWKLFNSCANKRAESIKML